MLLINDAIVFAAEMHKGVDRKGTKIPYIVHPFTSMYYLRDSGIMDEDVLAATLLHDVVEDANVTYENLEERFGARVAMLVRSVSENKDLSWDERKLHTIVDLKSCSYETKLITLADKYNNLNAIVKDHQKIGDELWKRFNKGYTQQKWYYTQIYDVLNTDIKIQTLSLFKEYEKLVLDFFEYS
jgi:(p)ppGpp synthase/HD superfamily hydrolase